MWCVGLSISRLLKQKNICSCMQPCLRTWLDRRTLSMPDIYLGTARSHKDENGSWSQGIPPHRGSLCFSPFPNTEHGGRALRVVRNLRPWNSGNLKIQEFLYQYKFLNNMSEFFEMVKMILMWGKLGTYWSTPSLQSILNHSSLIINHNGLGRQSLQSVRGVHGERTWISDSIIQDQNVVQTV